MEKEPFITNIDATDGTLNGSDILAQMRREDINPQKGKPVHALLQKLLGNALMAPTTVGLSVQGYISDFLINTALDPEKRKDFSPELQEFITSFSATYKNGVRITNSEALEIIEHMGGLIISPPPEKKPQALFKTISDTAPTPLFPDKGFPGQLDGGDLILALRADHSTGNTIAHKTLKIILTLPADTKGMAPGDALETRINTFVNWVNQLSGNPDHQDIKKMADFAKNFKAQFPKGVSISDAEANVLQHHANEIEITAPPAKQRAAKTEFRLI